MSRKTWHLDINFDDTLFARNWTPTSHALLLKLFAHLDSTDRPVLSMLPPGISPAGAAVAASFYFLPGIEAPPKPHCRIAVFPGLHFARQIKNISFDPIYLWRASQRARASQRGYPGVVGTFDKLRQVHKETDPPLFHWMFRCQRIWTRHWNKESQELLPRAYYGRNDPYPAIVDFIESEHLDLFSNKYEPYDLLIYCPYFHSRNSDQSDEIIDGLVNKVSSFAADRKLVIARSPFDYWSRRLESKFGTKGIAISPGDIGQSPDPKYQSDIRFVIVDQFINISEARDLHDEIGALSRNPNVDRSLINEVKFLLRRLLVSLDPTPLENEGSPEDLAKKLIGLVDALGFVKGEKGWRAIEKICSGLSAHNGAVKLEKLRELVVNGNYEIWVTKDLDRQILTDFKQKHNLDINVRLADRWMAPGTREPGKTVILSRIDREGDLDLTAYLRTNDAIVISAWEAVIRASSIMSSWERSERWRDQAKKLSIIESNKDTRQLDPVLDLANYLLASEENHKSKESPRAPIQEDNPISWWDDNDIGSILDTGLERTELIAGHGDKLFSCLELRFEGNFGMFVKDEDEMQVLGEDTSDGDILAVPTKDLKPGMTVILFKDAERNSIFDILMDQLERSSDYQDDARLVRKWKQGLREHALTKGLKVSSIQSELTSKGRTFDQITIRSWIFGSTMAPQKIEHLILLMDALNLKSIAPKSLFQSVKNLRSVARTLGRALNDLIIQKDSDKLDEHIRSALIGAGVDIEELSGAIETRKLTAILPDLINVENRSVRKIFRTNPI